LTSKPPVDPLEQRVLSRIPWEIGALARRAARLSLLFVDAVSSLLVLFGGLTAALGFISLQKLVFRLVKQGPVKGKTSILLLYGLRLLLIIALFFIIILLFSRKILAYAAGFSMIIPVFFIEAAGALFRMKQWKS
jgi:uncharacterized membrane protein YidH (DUF202 family)